MQVTLNDNGVLGRYAKQIERLSQEAPRELAATLNQVGAGIRRDTIRAEAKQTGLSARVIARAQREVRATASRLEFRIEAAGGNVGLKFFHPTEGRAGVTARPWGVAKMYQGSFIRGGRFPNRVVLSLGGRVFQRVGTDRSPIAKVGSGLFIPAEMTTGNTLRAFEQGAEKSVGVVLRRMAASCRDRLRVLPGHPPPDAGINPRRAPLVSALFFEVRTPWRRRIPLSCLDCAACVPQCAPAHPAYLRRCAPRGPTQGPPRPSPRSSTRSGKP